MKKIFLYAVAVLLSLGTVACNSDDPADATEKKVYGEGEAPYLRTNNAATNNANLVFQTTKITEPQYIYLKDYATSFHKNMNMTVDEVIAGLETGDIVFYNINTSRQCWDITPFNYNEGWMYDSTGKLTSDNPAFYVQFDKSKKALIVTCKEDVIAGAVASMDMGFAVKNGENFDTYVRFVIGAVVKDPSLIDCSGSVPAGDWASWSLDFNKYDQQLQDALGLTAKEFISLYAQCEPEYQWTSVEKDPIQVYLMKNGERVTGADGIHRPQSTTNFMGWWTDADQNIVPYGDSSFIFLEGDPGAGTYNFGRHPNVPSGTSATIIVDFALTEDLNRHIQFMVSLSFE